VSQYPFQNHSATPFNSGDVLAFNPEGRSEGLGTREEGIARQAVYSSFVDNEALGRMEALLHDLEARGINLVAMRQEMLGESSETLKTVQPSQPAENVSTPARKPDEYYVPGSQNGTTGRAA